MTWCEYHDKNVDMLTLIKFIGYCQVKLQKVLKNSSFLTSFVVVRLHVTALISMWKFVK